MISEFEYIIENLFQNPSKNLLENISDEVWLQCENIINQLKNNTDLYNVLQEYYVEQYRIYLGVVFHDFWSKFLDSAQTEKNNVHSHHRHVFLIIEYLYAAVEKWLSNPFIETLFNSQSDNNQDKSYFETEKRTFIDHLHDILYTSFISDMPLMFSNFLISTFTLSFKVFDHLFKAQNNNNSEEETNANVCSVCNFDDHNEKCYCHTIRYGYIKFRNIFRSLGIFDNLCDDIIRSVIYTSIEKHIFALCRGNNFDISCLDLTLNWFENSIVDWIKITYLAEAESGEDMMEVPKRFTKLNDIEMETINSNDSSNISQIKLNYHKVFGKISSLSSTNIRNFIINTYIYCRMKQLFEIIIDYPYSEAVLLDLHECIKIDPFYRKNFIYTLKSAFETRLLHPGVSTSDIIEAYITAIKALRLLDPQGIILQIVCDPVRYYLKSREDTVRCIITSLTNENLVDLSDPKDSIGAKEVKDEDESILDNWNTWVPQPIGASKLNKTLINADIISMLVNIFDSKDLFVQEYQRLLSQRLLMSFEINLEMEHRNLELLSLRFGESELHNCEVMLKDIKDSERVNHRINSGEIESSKPKHLETNGLILSEQFWPENFGFAQSFNDLRVLKLPAEVKEAQDLYTKAFETIKANRTVNWINQLGIVKLEIELNNGKNVHEYTVRPIQAAIICQFQNRKLWRISELAEELSVLPSAIRRHIGYWQNLGLLVEVSVDTFLFDEEGRHRSGQTSQQSLNASQEFDVFDAEIVDEDTRSNRREDDNRLQIFWNFIDNMLKNLHALTLDRIFSMLKMFHMQSSEIESLTMHELRQFLDRKVTEGKLVYVNGLYNLKSDSN